jgi:hypothetical protein
MPEKSAPAFPPGVEQGTNLCRLGTEHASGHDRASCSSDALVPKIAGCHFTDVDLVRSRGGIGLKRSVNAIDTSSGLE